MASSEVATEYAAGSSGESLRRGRACPRRRRCGRSTGRRRWPRRCGTSRRTRGSTAPPVPTPSPRDGCARLHPVRPCPPRVRGGRRRRRRDRRGRRARPCSSGARGASYGSSMPVIPVSSPARALAYRPLGSRCSHSASGVSTKTSTKRSPAASWAARTRSRSARYGLITGTSATRPASAISRATSPTRRTFSARSAAENPRSALSPWRTLSPSSTYVARPSASSRPATASASVDLPEPDSPVNHTVAPRRPVAAQRASRSTVAGVPEDPLRHALGAEHAGGGGLVRRLVDEDEAAGDAVAAVVVGEQRRRRPQRHPADLVERQLGRRRRRGAASARRAGSAGRSPSPAPCGWCA